MPISIDGSGTISGLSVGGLPNGTITTSNIANLAVTPETMSQKPTLMTAQNSTSGTVIDFIGIPSWAKRIKVMYIGVSTNGSSILQIQIGSGSFTTTGYSGACTAFGSTQAVTNNFTSGLVLSTGTGDTAAAVRHGISEFNLFTGNTWVGFGSIQLSNDSFGGVSNTSVTLSDTLDRVRITTVNGTNTFDGGTINIMYE